MVQDGNIITGIIMVLRRLGYASITKRPVWPAAQVRPGRGSTVVSLPVLRAHDRA